MIKKKKEAVVHENIIVQKSNSTQIAVYLCAMKMLEQVAYGKMQISYFETETHFSVKIEAAAMAQTYRIAKERVDNLDSLKAKITDSFLDDTVTLFESMFERYKDLAS